MKKFEIKSRGNKEKLLQQKIIRMLRFQEWNCIATHGNLYQAGFPDLYCFHHVYGERWIEVKVPGEGRFTDYQAYYFPIIKNVWVLQGTSNTEYMKLFRDPNYARELVGEGVEKKKETVVQKHLEGQIQKKVEVDLEAQGYTVMATFGNNIQKGLPDLYIIKGSKRQWVELKRIMSFTPAQIKNFPRMIACGVKIWILDVSGGTYDLSILKREPNCKLGEL